MTRSDRAACVAGLGHTGPLAGEALATVLAAARDDEAPVRAVAVAALVRAGPVPVAAPAWAAAVADPDPAVRRRAAELAPALLARERAPDPAVSTALVGLLDDPEVTVVEAAAWALGEQGGPAPRAVVDALGATATGHADALAREAAVGALGAIGDPAGLAAVLTACRDKPAVRRRAVLALAPFTGPAVDAALAAALGDRDWQVRQAAEDLLAAGGGEDT
ncbi:MAG: HEAT repeat domain-containing protein [Actinomycetota bacterium]